MDSTYLGIYVYINSYMHAVTIDEKRDYELKGEWAGVCCPSAEGLEGGKGRENNAIKIRS